VNIAQLRTNLIKRTSGDGEYVSFGFIKNIEKNEGYTVDFDHEAKEIRFYKINSGVGTPVCHFCISYGFITIHIKYFQNI
jgi:hypothetical protein